MTMAQVELSLALTRSTARQLRQLAQAHGVTDAAVVEQALALLFEREDGSLRQDYWLSLASMQEDWETMPDDWIADEVRDATSSW